MDRISTISDGEIELKAVRHERDDDDRGCRSGLRPSWRLHPSVHCESDLAGAQIKLAISDLHGTTSKGMTPLRMPAQIIAAV